MHPLLVKLVDEVAYRFMYLARSGTVSTVFRRQLAGDICVKNFTAVGPIKRVVLFNQCIEIIINAALQFSTDVTLTAA